MQLKLTYLIAILVVAICAGCGSDPSDRHKLTGKASYGGVAIPAGVVQFRPDPDRGNKGPASTATIANGWYKTLPGSGVMQGPYIVTVAGFDGVPVKYEKDAAGKLEPGIPVKIEKSELANKKNMAGVKISAQGQPLFKANYEIRLELKKGKTTLDIDIPKSSEVAAAPTK